MTIFFIGAVIFVVSLISVKCIVSNLLDKVLSWNFFEYMEVVESVFFKALIGVVIGLFVFVLTFFKYIALSGCYFRSILNNKSNTKTQI